MRCRRLIPAALLALLLSVPGRLAGASAPFVWSLDAIAVRGRGDSLSVSLTWTFRNWNVEPSKAVVFAPSVRSGERSVPLRPVSVYGRKAAQLSSRPFASGNARECSVLEIVPDESFTTVDVFPKQDWMDTLKVCLSVYDWSRRGGLVLKSTSQRAAFCKPPRPDDPSFPWSLLVPFDDPSETRELVFSAPVSFEGNRMDISNMKMDRVDEYLLFQEKVKEVSSTRRFTVRQSELTLTAAPCGDAKAATKQTRTRVNAVYSYLQKTGLFRVHVPRCTGGGEDWKGVADWVGTSRFRDDERLREILSLNLGPEYAFEALGREKPAAMEALGKDCFPYLDRITYRAVIRPAKFREPKFIQPVYDKVPEALSAKDFWTLSSDYRKGSDQWTDILLTGALLHPEDGRLNYDAAMALLDSGTTAGVVPLLRNLGSPESGGLSAEGEYAYAVWLFRSGRLAEALERLGRLKDKSVFYRSVWEQAAPFIDWYTDRVDWVRVYL